MYSISVRYSIESNDVSIASMASQYAGGGHHMVPGVRRGLLEALDHSQASELSTQRGSNTAFISAFIYIDRTTT